MSNHTPGPWVVSRDFEILTDNNDEVADTYIADIVSVNGNYTDEDEAERMANARLIAASPELLAACEFVLQAITDGLPTRRVFAVMNTLQTAIEKAKGIEP